MQRWRPHYLFWGECGFAGSHVVGTGYITGGRRVARAPLNPLAICDGLAYAEADEVVAVARSATKPFCEKSQWNALDDKGVQFTGRQDVSL